MLTNQYLGDVPAFLVVNESLFINTSNVDIIIFVRKCTVEGLHNRGDSIYLTFLTALNTNDELLILEVSLRFHKMIHIYGPPLF